MNEPIDPGYHRNEFGELVPHAVGTIPVDTTKVVDELLKAVRL